MNVTNKCFKRVKLVCIFLLFGDKITVILIILFVVTVFFKCLPQSHYFCNINTCQNKAQNINVLL